MLVPWFAWATLNSFRTSQLFLISSTNKAFNMTYLTIQPVQNEEVAMESRPRPKTNLTATLNTIHLIQNGFQGEFGISAEICGDPASEVFKEDRKTL